MKKLLLLAGLFISVQILHSQVGIGTTTPDPSSSLDVSATNKGILIPRVSLSDVADTVIDGVNTAATGLLIFNTNAATTGGTGVGYYYFNGTTWERLITSASATDDIDWYEEGTTTSPDAITDDMYTQGNVAIGKTTADYPLEVEGETARGINTLVDGSSTGATYGTYTDNASTASNFLYGSFVTITGNGTSSHHGTHSELSASGSGARVASFNYLLGNSSGIVAGVGNTILNTGNGTHYGVNNNIIGDGFGVQYGVNNNISNTGDGTHYGTNNSLSGTGAGTQYGTYNDITNSSDGIHFGVYNSLSGTGSGTHYGNYSFLNPSGSGNQYGTFNNITSTQDGNYVGSYNYINSSGGGIQTGAVSLLHNNGTGERRGLFVSFSGTGVSSHFGALLNLGAGGDGDQYGIRSTITNGGNGLHHGMYNILTSSGTGWHIGVRNDISGNPASGNTDGIFNNISRNGSGIINGVRNDLTSTSSTGLKTGVANTISGSGSSKIGVNNSIQGTATASQIGVNNALSTASNVIQYGINNTITASTGNNSNTFGTYNVIGGGGNGAHYGTYNNIGGSGTGTQYGVFSDFSNTGASTIYGNYNAFNSNSNANKTGAFANFGGSGTGSQTGYRADFGTSSSSNSLGFTAVLGGANNGLQTGFDVLVTNAGTGTKTGLDIDIDGDDGIVYGINTDISGTSSSSTYGVRSIISRTGTGNQYGTYNDLTSDVTGDKYGVYNYLDTNGNANQIGVRSIVNTDGTGLQVGMWSTTNQLGTGIGYGIRNVVNSGTTTNYIVGIENVLVSGSTGASIAIDNTITTNSNSLKYGLVNDFGNTVGGDTSNLIGTYHDFSDVTGTGNKTGTFIEIPSTTGGINFGIFADVTDTANDYAGYFDGRLSIGSAGSNYIMPISRGTANQVMQTDGTGNVSWIDASALDDGDWVDVGADIERQSGDVYIGNTNLTNNDIYISNHLIDWDNTSYSLDPASDSFLNEASFDVGSASDVSIYFGDANSGFYSPNTSEVGYSVNGSEKMRIDANGAMRLYDTDDASGTVGSGVLEIANSLRIDGNEIITNTGTSLLLNYNNGGDVFIDLNTLAVDASTNRVGIGVSTPSFQLQLSSSSAGKPTSGLWTVISDRQLKKDIKPFKDGLSLLNKINPVWFTYNGKAGMPNETGVGTIAQELQKIAPYMVKNWEYNSEDGKVKENYLGVDYGAMDFILVNAIKEQQGIIEKQQKEIENLKKDIAEIRALLKKN